MTTASAVTGWIETDDLESDLKLAEDDSEALKLENPLEQPCPDLGWALLHAADEQGVDARTHVGLDASADLAEVIESGEFTRNQLERLFGALRHPWESESGCWHRLRSLAEWKRDRAARNRPPAKARRSPTDDGCHSAGFGNRKGDPLRGPPLTRVRPNTPSTQRAAGATGIEPATRKCETKPIATSVGATPAWSSRASCRVAGM